MPFELFYAGCYSAYSGEPDWYNDNRIDHFSTFGSLNLNHWISDYMIIAKFRGGGGSAMKLIRVNSLLAKNEKSKLI